MNMNALRDNLVAVKLTPLSVLFVLSLFVLNLLISFSFSCRYSTSAQTSLHSCTPTNTLSVGKLFKEHAPKCFLYFLCDKKCFLHHKDTERGIKQLQTQLHSREQELILERNLRRQLQRELDNKTNRNSLGVGDDVENVASNFLMDDYAKPYAYF